MSTAAPSRPKRRLLLLFGFLALLFISTAAGIAGDTKPNPSISLSTTSPADGQTVSGSIAWQVASQGKAPSRVDFLVDGAVKWTEYYAPYVFNGDGGSLDTKTLADGQHKLQANAYDGSLQAASSTVTVTVANGTATGTAGGTTSGAKPSPVTVPTISGFAGQGQALSAGNGAWSGSPSGYAYQWQRCDSSGGTCANVAGATAASYDILGGDVGSTLRVVVTASNAAGSTSAPSAATAVARADRALGRPASASSIENTSLAPAGADDGSQSTRWSSSWQDNQWWQVDLGTTQSIDTVAIDWEAAYAKSYAIQVSSDGGAFVGVASVSNGAAGWVATTFPAVSARYIRVLGLTRGTQYGFSAWSIQAFGSTSSSGTTTTGSTAPIASTPPTISGTPVSGQVLQVSPGTWSGATSYAYLWQRCDQSGAVCGSIGTATGTSYTLAPADAGSTIRVQVTATNAVGSSSALSAPTAVVAQASTTVSGALGTSLPTRLGQSTGQSFYVDGVSGSDSNPGTIAAPWKTITKAWQTVPLAGSTIYVRAGTYAYQINLTNRLATATSPVTVRAYPGERVVLTGSGTGGYPALFVARASGVRIEGFVVSDPVGDGIRVDGAADVEIVGNTITHNGMQGVMVGGSATSGQTYSTNVQIWANRFYGNGGYWPGGDPYAALGTHSIYYGNTPSNTDGIQHGAVGGVIADNLFYDQPNGYHVQVGSQNNGLIITNNSFYNAYQPDTRAGNAIQIYGESNQFATKNVLVVNNIISTDANHGVYGSGPSMPSNVVRNNLAWKNPLGDFVAQYGTSTLFTLGPGNVAGIDPKFVSASADDFHLASGSAAIGRADPAYAPPTDFDGRARSSAPDLGALEYGG